VVVNKAQSGHAVRGGGRQDEHRIFTADTYRWNRSDVMTTLDPQRCCCGRLYRDSGGTSSRYCPEGKRLLCEECATKGRALCPIHKVPIKF
jgi:hypothetical protein